MTTYEGIVVQHYRLTRLLGEGGFGAVYAAEHVELGRLAAVKILDPAYARHPEVIARFHREARLAAAVRHPAIVDVLDVGTLPSGEPYIMMEHVAGRSLAAVLEADGALPLAGVRAVFEPLYAAVGAAHARGIVHRDLKPHNVMIGDDGAVKLLDFGIAKLIETGATAMTRTGSVMGTLPYMAPEQASDAKHVDVRADVYALAGTLWASLVGRAPFSADSTPALLLRIVSEPPPSARSLRPEVPAALDAAIARGLAKRPEDRPPTAAEAWREIAAALDGVAAPSPERPRSAPPPERARSAPPSRGARSPAWVPLLGAGALAAAAIAIAAYLLTRREPIGPRDPVTTPAPLHPAPASASGSAREAPGERDLLLAELSDAARAARIDRVVVEPVGRDRARYVILYRDAAQRVIEDAFPGPITATMHAAAIAYTVSPRGERHDAASPPAPGPAEPASPPATTIGCGCPELELDCAGRPLTDSSFHIDCTLRNRGRDAACRPELHVPTYEVSKQLGRLNPGQRGPRVDLTKPIAILADTTGLTFEVEARADGGCPWIHWTDFVPVAF